MATQWTRTQPVRRVATAAAGKARAGSGVAGVAERQAVGG